MIIGKNKILLLNLILIPPFFLKGVQFLLNRFNGNWAYIIDQLGLAAVSVSILFIWLRKKRLFKLSKTVVLIIVALVLVTHYNSFFRAIFDEWLNIIGDINLIHYTKTDPSATGFYITRDRYAWGPFVAFYETVGIDKPYSNFLMSSFGIIAIVGASLAGAWLAGVVFKNNLASLITGLLIGISPNTFASLAWPSSVQGDSLGVILTIFTVSAWIIARKTKDKRGILISLLLLAASLKGGGSVRTIMVGILLILSDLVLFRKYLNKKWVWDWLAVVLIEVFYYLATPAVHLVPREESVSAVVRVAQLMELTAKSLVPPTILAKLITIFLPVKINTIWVVVIGSIIFMLGWLFALLGFIKKKWSLFVFAWIWFFATIFYAPWFAEGYGKTLASINDRMVFNIPANAGFKYAYLPLVALHIFLAVVLAKLIKIKKKLGILLTVLIIGFRGIEFLKLDHDWKLQNAIPNREWQQLLFNLIPIQSADPAKPKALVLVDGKNNPLVSQSFPVQHGMYIQNSVVFYNSVSEFFKNDHEIGGLRYLLDDIFAFGWDSGSQKAVDLTRIYRDWIKDAKKADTEIHSFSDWKSDFPLQDGFIMPGEVYIGNVVNPVESKFTSPELSIPVPNPNNINLEVGFNTEALFELKPSGDRLLTLAILCNSDHGIKKQSDLINNQKTVEDQLNFSRVRVKIYNHGSQTAAVTTKCEGPVIKKIVISGSPNFKYKLNRIRLGFSYP